MSLHNRRTRRGTISLPILIYQPHERPAEGLLIQGNLNAFIDLALTLVVDDVNTPHF